jgi:hypothetical protein
MRTLKHLNQLEYLKTLAKIWLTWKVNARLMIKACMRAGLSMSLPQEKRGLRTCH